MSQSIFDIIGYTLQSAQQFVKWNKPEEMDFSEAWNLFKDGQMDYFVDNFDYSAHQFIGWTTRWESIEFFTELDDEQHFNEYVDKQQVYYDISVNNDKNNQFRENSINEV